MLSSLREGKWGQASLQSRSACWGWHQNGLKGKSQCPREGMGMYFATWVTGDLIFTQRVILSSVRSTCAIKSRLEPLPMLSWQAFQSAWISIVSGGWRCWRVYFSDEAGDEVLTACCYSRADGAFCAEKANDSCPVWTHYVPLQFPWHFAVLGPNNCSVLVKATVVNSEPFQPRCSVMTGPVMKLNLVLI